MGGGLCTYNIVKVWHENQVNEKKRGAAKPLVASCRVETTLPPGFTEAAEANQDNQVTAPSYAVVAFFSFSASPALCFEHFDRRKKRSAPS